MSTFGLRRLIPLAPLLGWTLALATLATCGSSPATSTPAPTLDAAAQVESDARTDAAEPSDAPAGAPDAASQVAPDAAVDALANGPKDIAAPDTTPDPCPPTASTQVLFLGNSYTSVNDLPGLFSALATSLGAVVVVDDVSPGGMTLGAPPNAHTLHQPSLDKLHERSWQVVVLQEQSQIPTIAPYKSAFMLTGAQKLEAHLRKVNSCAAVRMYLTWGRKAGGQQCAGTTCSPPFADFGQMQDALTAAYLEVATAIGAGVVPVGEAWRAAIAAQGPELFSDDGSHPSLAGAYLSACVFYAAIFGKSPAGGAVPAGLDATQGAMLQEIAAKTVLADLPKWKL